MSDEMIPASELNREKYDRLLAAVADLGYGVRARSVHEHVDGIPIITLELMQRPDNSTRSPDNASNPKSGPTPHTQNRRPSQGKP